MTIEKGKLATSIEKKEVKTKIIYLDDAGNDKLLHWLLLSLAYWLMLERILCVYDAGLKVDVSREILTVIMTSYYEIARSCKRHTVVHRVFCCWWFALHFLGLATHYRESSYKCHWARACEHKLHPVTWKVISQYWNRICAFCNL